jgi:hypothetical protein
MLKKYTVIDTGVAGKMLRARALCSANLSNKAIIRLATKRANHCMTI